MDQPRDVVEGGEGDHVRGVAGAGRGPVGRVSARPPLRRRAGLAWLVFRVRHPAAALLVALAGCCLVGGGLGYGTSLVVLAVQRAL